MKKRVRVEWVLLAAALLVPLVDLVLSKTGFGQWRIGNEICQRVLIFAIMALGLNIVVGYTGLLHLGVAAFMAIGVYAYAILTCNIYPFQIGFWWALVAAPLLCAAAGLVLGSPTIRLRGDYLAIVTLGFGEITQDVLKNIDTVTKGTQGINPLPPPSIPGYRFQPMAYEPWYYLYLAVLILLILVVRNLERSRIGRQWTAIREDELAASCMGINPNRAKLLAFAIAAAVCGVAGVLWASKLESTAEPASYDFMVSITVLCIVIVGGLGTIKGVLVGTCMVMGFDILLKKATEEIQRQGLVGSANVWLTPTNWKFFAFGLALVLMMRFKPRGFFPEQRTAAGEDAAGRAGGEMTAGRGGKP